MKLSFALDRCTLELEGKFRTLKPKQTMALLNDMWIYGPSCWNDLLLKYWEEAEKP